MCVLHALAALTSTAPSICSPAAVAAPRRQRALMLGTLACRAGKRSAIMSRTRPQRTRSRSDQVHLHLLPACLQPLPVATARCCRRLLCELKKQFSEVELEAILGRDSEQSASLTVWSTKPPRLTRNINPLEQQPRLGLG